MAAQTVVASDYQPFASQLAAHAAPQRWTLYGGGEGGGKSRWMVEEIITLMMQYPGIEGIVGRHDQNDTFQPTQIYDLFHLHCPPSLIQKEVRSYPMWTRFHNGSRVTWTGFKDYSPSAEYGFCAIDQAEECDETTIRLLNGRLRQRLPNGEFPRFRMLLTCNPHPNIEWFLRAAKEDPDEFCFIRALHSDNIYLPPDFVDTRKKSYSVEYFKRLVEGNWDAFAGQALAEFNRAIHVVEPFDAWRKDKWAVYLGIDFGTSAPTVGEWCAVSPDGHLFFVQEYEQANASPETNARAMKALSKDMALRGVWLDPRANMVKADLNRRVTWSVYDEYKKYFPNIQLAKTSREARLAAWNQAIHLSPDLSDYRTFMPPAPRVYIFETCPSLANTLPRLQYREVNIGHSDDVTKSNDHWYDAGGFVLTHLLKTKTPYYQIRDYKVGLDFGGTGRKQESKRKDFPFRG